MSKQALDLAWQQYHGGNLQAARQTVEGVLRAEPAHVDALLLAAELYRRDNPAIAVKVYARASQLAPTRPEGPAGLALLYHEQGNVDKCDQCLDACLDLDPEYLRCRYYADMARAAQAVRLHGPSARDTMVDFFDGIAAAYQRAAGRYVDSPLIAFNLGRILFVLGEAELASQAYQRCLELDPDMTAAYAGMAEATLALEQFEEAVEWCHMIEGRIWTVSGNTNDPAWMMARATAGDLSLGQVYLAQAKAHLWMGQFEPMAQAIRRAVEMEPWRSGEWFGNFLDEHVRLARALSENEQLADAVRVLEAGRDLAKRVGYHSLFLALAEAYLAQANVYLESKDRAQAEPWLARARDIVNSPPVTPPAEARPDWDALKARLPGSDGLFGFLRK